MASKMKTLDANEAVAMVAHRLSEVIAIYPITPSSPMGEWADEWASIGTTNIWGDVPSIMEMQSEGGAAGAVHGALTAGALSTTFTASQGLLLMIPNMYKIAGELSPMVMHVTARTLATHALCIFGDHGDVMACRQTGFAMLCSNSVQEAHDLAAIAHSATLVSRVPFLHFFDGFRTSHEVAKIHTLSDEDLSHMVNAEMLKAHRGRALTPDHPAIRGTAQNPDVFFQAREACNGFYTACPGIVQAEMDKFAALTGRQYHLFDYVGDPQATKVIVIMGSGAETAEETVHYLAAKGEKVGVLKVRLFRPWTSDAFLAALPATVKSIAVLDRTKEPGAAGEPLFQDVITALRYDGSNGKRRLQSDPKVINGRYGLGSKEFTPGHIKAVFDEMAKETPKRVFTVAINDDVTHLSLPIDESFDIEPASVKRAVFYGLGSDGTVGANKNTIKIIGDETTDWVQGYFVYDSKKSGAVTISHLRFGPKPIQSPYLIRRAQFVACHMHSLMERYDITELAEPGAILLLNTPVAPENLWLQVPPELVKQVIDKKLKVYVIDALKVARQAGVGNRINTIMQVCYFQLAGIMPQDQAIAHIKHAIEKSYGRKGEEVVKRNYAAVDLALANLKQAPVPTHVPELKKAASPLAGAPDFVRNVTAVMLAGKGDLLPVSAFPVDGTWPLSTTKWEKRNIAAEIPVWEPELCIQCNKCSFVCPHASIRAKVYEKIQIESAPKTFKSIDYKAPDFKGQKFTIQVAPEDCTGCGLCVQICPAKDKTQPKRKAINMTSQPPLRATEVENYKFFLALPEVDRTKVRIDVKGSQFFQPLFEYSGACAGCGETPYVKLMSQLFGDRAMIANATGCSSIYGGNLPTTPYCTDRAGRGPSWSNSLFEDNAEFGLGMRLAVDAHKDQARRLLGLLAPQVGAELANGILTAKQETELEIEQQRGRVRELRAQLAKQRTVESRRLNELADYLVKKSVWILGGDGWAYDIGYGGLDHVLASGRNVNVLVLDTEVYSNTGGQQSKSTPTGASAKFAVAGKVSPKKDLALMALAYGNVFVAKVAWGAKDAQVVKAFVDAESYDGPSLIMAYSPCIAHGYELSQGAEQQKKAVDSGYWPLFRYDPRLVGTDQNPYQIDSGDPKTPVEQFMHGETRFRVVEQKDAERYKHLVVLAQHQAENRWAMMKNLASGTAPKPKESASN